MPIRIKTQGFENEIDIWPTAYKSSQRDAPVVQLVNMQYLYKSSQRVFSSTQTGWFTTKDNGKENH